MSKPDRCEVPGCRKGTNVGYDAGRKRWVCERHWDLYLAKKFDLNDVFKRVLEKEAAATVAQTVVSTGDSCAEPTRQGACTRTTEAPVAEKPDQTGGSGGGESPPQRSSLLRQLIRKVEDGPKS